MKTTCLKVFNVMLATCFVLVLAGSVMAAPSQRSEDFSETHWWWSGSGNTTAPQNFGISASTNNAGGAAAGEAGGWIERSPVAYFADGQIGTLDLATDDLSVSAKVMIDGNGNPGLGYFNAADYLGDGEPQKLVIFGFRVDDTDVYALANGFNAQVGALAAGTPSTIVMTYTAATGACSWTLDGGTPLELTQTLTGTIDQFGIIPLGWSSGAGVNFWIDDLDYTVGKTVVVPVELSFISAE